MNLSIIVSVSFSNMLMLRDWNCKTHCDGYIEPRREQVRLQEELSTQTKVLRDTQILSLHEMREMKRAQYLRDDQVSVQKLRENHETIQKLTSQLQEMQNQMISMNDSGEAQEAELNHRGTLSHVSQSIQKRFQVLPLC